MVEQTQPDVVLMDLKMPEMNGVQATREITDHFPDTKVVALTTYDADDWVFDAIKAGVRGYLLKDSSSDDIMAAIRGAVAGEVMIDPAVAARCWPNSTVWRWLDRLARPGRLSGFNDMTVEDLTSENWRSCKNGTGEVQQRDCRPYSWPRAQSRTM